MSKILVLNGHPNPMQSLAGAAILKELTHLRPDVTVHGIRDALRADGTFDVPAEQRRLVQAGVIVWQFPFFWYGVPSLMKKWIEDVLVYGFAFGETGTALTGKKVILSFTTGADAAEYSETGRVGLTIEGLLPPLYKTVEVCGMQVSDALWSTSMSFVPGVHDEAYRRGILAKAREQGQRLAKALETIGA